MKRTTPFKPDEKDKQILYWLDVNGRMPFTQLGKKVKLSKQTATYRVQRLEQEGFIKGYFPLIDTAKLGFLSFRVYLKLRGVTPKQKTALINNLKKQKPIWAVILIAGKWDIALGISVKTIQEFYTVWENILKEHLPEIKDYATSIYSPIFHYAKSYLINKPDISPLRILGEERKAKFDQKDLSILTALAKNARASLLDISDHVKLSPELVKYRMKRMEKEGIIQGYRAMIDVSKLGYHFYKLEICLKQYTSIEKILAFCHHHQNIYQVDKTIGGETLEVEFHVTSIQELYDLMGEFEKAFPGIVESFDYITVLEEIKTTHMPEI